MVRLIGDLCDLERALTHTIILPSSHNNTNNHINSQSLNINSQLLTISSPLLNLQAQSRNPRKFTIPDKEYKKILPFQKITGIGDPNPLLARLQNMSVTDFFTEDPASFHCASDISKMERIYRLGLNPNSDISQGVILVLLASIGADIGRLGLSQAYVVPGFGPDFYERIINTYVYIKSKSIETLLMFIPKNQRDGIKGQMSRFCFLFEKIQIEELVMDREFGQFVPPRCVVQLSTIKHSESREASSLEAQSLLSLDVSSYIFQMIDQYLKTSVKNIIEKVKTFLKSILDKILEVVGKVSSIIRNAFNCVIDYCTEFFSEFFDLMNSEVHFDYKNVKLQRDILLGLCVIFFLSLVGIGILEYKTFKNFMEYGTYGGISSNVHTTLEAQGPVPDNVSGLVTLFTTFASFAMNFSVSEAKGLSDVLSTVSKSITWGNSIKNLALAGLTLVPSFWIYRFSTMMSGGSDIKTKITQWINDVLALNSVRSVPEIMYSDLFIIKVDTVVVDGVELLKEAKTEPDNEKLINRILGYFSRAIDLLKQTNVTRWERVERRVPFVIHLAALPGTGKNLIHNRLVEKVANLGPQEIYEVPVGNAHWDGLQDPKGIVIDEFLVGTEERVTETAMNYLKLCSNSKFIPPRAGVEEKGQLIRPKIVLTMNNQLYPVARFGLRNYTDDAQYRRRDYVIEMRCLKEYFLQHPNVEVGMVVQGEKFLNKIPLKHMSQEDIDKVAWARFRFVPRLPTPLDNQDFVTSSSEWKTFNEIVADLQEAYLKHQELALKIEATLGIKYDEVTATKVWEKVQSIMLGAPINPMSIHPDFSLTAQTRDANTIGLEIEKLQFELARLRNELEPDISAPSEAESFSTGASTSTVARKKKKNRRRTREMKTTFDNNMKLWKESIDTKDTTLLQEATKSFVLLAANAITERMVEESKVSTVQMIECNRNHLDSLVFRELGQKFAAIPSKLATIFQSNFVRIGAAMSTFLGLIWSLYKLNNPKDDSPNPFEAESEKPQTTSKVAPKKIKVKKPNRSKCTGCRLRLKHNCKLGDRKHIFAQGDDGSDCYLKIITKMHTFDNTIVPVGARDYLVNTHAFQHHEIINSEIDDLTVTVTVYGNTYIIDDYDLIVLENKDVTLLRLNDKHIPLFKDQLYKFITGQDLNLLQVSDINADLGSLMNDHPVQFSTEDISYKFRGDIITINSFIWYDHVPCTKGTCGTPLILNCPHIPSLHGKIAGIHAAGDPDSQKGLSSVITKNHIEMAQAETNELEAQSGDSEELPELLGDNVYDLALAPMDLRIYVPSRTVLRPSYLNLDPHCYLSTTKQPAIMSQHDNRAKGIDPKANYIRSLSATSVVQPSDEDLSEIFKAIETRLKETLYWPVKRYLTINEAIGGIPGILASVKVITSCGYPLIYSRRGKGKTDHIWFNEEGKPVWTTDFEAMVRRKVYEIENYEGQPIDHMFIGYLKDELVSEKKISDVNTRVIFCNNMISLVAFRIVFGSLLCAFHNSFPFSDYAIGMNATTYDMDVLFAKHKRRMGRFLAGDYSNFDKTLISSIRDGSYRLCGRLLNSSPKSISYLIKHECYSKYLLGPYLFNIENNNCSGGFLTTIINCLQNDFYLRWAFKYIFPNESYDKNVISILLGDDHHTSFAENLEVNPHDFQRFFESKGLKYGSAFKGEELPTTLVNFENTIFLGCIPVCHNTKYTGALKKESIEGALTYTRDKHLTFLQTIHQQVETASQWGSEYYNFLIAEINASHLRCERRKITFEPWETMFRIQASRGSINKRFSLLSQIGYTLNIPPQLVPFEGAYNQLTMQNKTTNYSDLNAADSNKKRKTLKPFELDSLEAQGNISSTNINYSYDNITGDIPTQHTIAVKNKPNNALKAKATLPMDNPPMSGGHVPVAHQFSSLSKSIGVEPTVSLQFDQAMLFRQNAEMADVEDMGIESICARRNYVGGFTWADSDLPNKVLAGFPLNSILSNTNPVGSVNLGPGVMLLNQFQFWRADIVIDVFVPKTMFHSGKLVATVAYGAPSIADAEARRYLNYELDFSGTNMWHQIVIPYQAATEYLRTFEGSAAPDRVQDYSMAYFDIRVLNELTANSAVSSSVTVHFFPRFKNVHVYEMRARPWLQFDTWAHYAGPEVKSISEISNLTLEAQSNDPITLKNDDSSTTGLTTLDTRLAPTSNYPAPSINNSHSSITEPFYDFKYALESKIRRNQLTWSSTTGAGALLTSIDIPWGFIDSSANATIQDMAFNNYVYFSGDFELTFQVNGPPTAYGAVWVCFAPLTKYQSSEIGPWIYGLDGVWLVPNGDTTVTLKIPFKFYRNVMNTFVGGSLSAESLGTVLLVNTQPLVANAGISCTITYFSAMKNSYFSIVRPRAVSFLDELKLKEEKATIKLEAQSSDPIQVTDQDPEPEQEQKVLSALPMQIGERTSRRNLGAKFEFTQTSLVDVLRRHSRFDLDMFLFNGVGWAPQVFGDNAQYNTPFNTFVIPVVPLHRLCCLFKGWSGHLKYRIFVPKNGWCKVHYVSAGSYAKRPGATPELSTCVGDAEGGAGNNILATWDVVGTVVQQRARFNDDKPQEYAYPLPGNYDQTGTNVPTAQSWLDFSIPFNTHMNFLPVDVFNDDFASSVTGSDVHKNNLANGYIILRYGNKILSDNSAGIELYQAVGDDFALHCYKPNYKAVGGPVVYSSGTNPYTSSKTVAYYGNYMGANVTEY